MSDADRFADRVHALVVELGDPAVGERSGIWIRVVGRGRRHGERKEGELGGLSPRLGLYRWVAQDHAAAGAVLGSVHCSADGEAVSARPGENPIGSRPSVLPHPSDGPKSALTRLLLIEHEGNCTERFYMKTLYLTATRSSF